MSRPGLIRHERKCMHRAAARKQELQDMLSADNLLQMLSGLNERTLRILDRNEQQGDDRTALMAVRESRNNIEAYSRIAQPDEPEERIQAAIDEAAHQQAVAAELRHRFLDGSYETITWEEWMGPKDNLAALLRAIDLATEMGKDWYGPRTLEYMQREYERIMARRPTSD